MSTTKPDAISELLDTYGETGGINYLDAAAMLPSRGAVELACADLLSLMFPGLSRRSHWSIRPIFPTSRAAGSDRSRRD